MISELILIVAVTVDIFIMSISCGTDCIRIPIKSAISIGIVGTVIMAISLYFSDIVSSIISFKVGSVICCAVLCAMGGMNIIKWILEKHKYRKSTKDASMLDVFICGSCADCDNSKEISVKEAIAVSTLMSLDTLICGVASGSSLNVYVVLIGTFIFQSISVLVGCLIGRKFSKVPDISFMGGILLIVLGIFKVI